MIPARHAPVRCHTFEASSTLMQSVISPLLSIYPPCEGLGCRRRCASMLAPAAGTFHRRPLLHSAAVVADAPAVPEADASGESSRHKPEGLQEGAWLGRHTHWLPQKNRLPNEQQA